MFKNHPFFTDSINFSRRNPLFILAGLYIGGLIAGGVIPSIKLVLGISGILTTFLWLPKFPTYWKQLILLCTIFCLGWIAASWHTHQQFDRLSILRPADGDTITVSGIVRKSATTPYGRRTIVEGKLQSIPNSPEYKFYVYHDSLIVPHTGDSLLLSGRYEIPQPPRNPGDFDFKQYQLTHGLYGRIFTDQIEDLTLLTTASRFGFTAKIKSWQQNINASFRQYLDPDVAGLMSALITGSRSSVDENLRQQFVDTGVVHVLAVSGLHVGYVLIIIMLFANLLRIPWQWKPFAIILGLILFVLISGQKPSVIRAATMAGLYIIAPRLNRQASLWNIIGVTALIMLIIQPGALQDLGFVFSFSAVASIVFFLGQFQKILPEKYHPERISNPGLKLLWGMFLVSIAAQLGTLPLTAIYFQRIPVISLIANILIVPLIGCQVALGFILLLFGWIPGVGYIYGHSAWLIYQITDALTGQLSSLPFAYLTVGNWSWLYTLGYGLCLTAILLLLQPENQWRWRAVFPVLILAIMLIWNWSLEKRQLQIWFLDVGQGDATLIQCPDDKTILVDAGERLRWKDYGRDVVIPVSRSLGINKITYAVMSHPHNDHIGGFIATLRTLPVDTVIDTWSQYNSWTYQEIHRISDSLQIPVVRRGRDDFIRLAPDCYIQILAPVPTMKYSSHSQNNRSLVFRLVFGRTSVLFLGDAEIKEEQLLLRDPEYVDSDVLKVAHHGSITSSTPALLDRISPSLAVISVGDRNKFGHPSELVLQRFQSRNIPVLRTDQSGAVHIVSNGEQIGENPWR